MSSILSFIQFLVNSISSLFVYIIQTLAYIPNFITSILQVINCMPSWLIPIILSCLFLNILIFVIHMVRG